MVNSNRLKNIRVYAYTQNINVYAYTSKISDTLQHKTIDSCIVNSSTLPHPFRISRPNK